MIFRKKAVERLLRFDMIRFLKLAEITQYSVIAFVFALLLGTFVNKNMPSTLDDDKKQKNVLIISLETIIHISILIIIAYYLKKFVAIFPFLFKWVNKKYIPSYHQESTIGIAIGVGYIFNKTQHKLVNKIVYLTEYFNLKS
tara:strand:- start:2193 stop:2618 length:426 start_codon:yes stop_codon:yes gene_type:complete